MTIEKGFDRQTNSPLQYYRPCEESSVEVTPTDINVG